MQKSESEVSQSCPTLSDPMDCSLLGFSVHGSFQARVLEWGATAFYNVTAISYFWPPNVNDRSQNCHPEGVATPIVIAEELEEYRKQGEQGNRIGPK